MIRAQGTISPEWITSIYDEDEDKTEWKIGPLNQEQLEEVLFGSGQVAGMVELSPQGIRTALKYGLLDWRGFQDSEKEVPFSRSEFKRIPADIRSELAWKIIGKSRITEEEAKN